MNSLKAQHFRVITESQFLERFTPLQNHLDKTASFDFGDGGCLFSATGIELKFVLAQKPRCVWTLVDGDEGEILLVSGLHIVNRLGYLVTREPADADTDYTVTLD